MQRALSDSLLSDLSGHLGARLGLHFPPERWADLDRGVAAAAPELGYPDPASCARGLLSGALTRRHVELLASHLTVGETYFFRDPVGLEAFEHRIVPELLRSRRDGERRLRIWSAGCCTGEEPYTIAMLLDLLIGNAEAWNVTILATDINPQFLRKAAEGVYGEWSFRATPGASRERYFERRKDGRFELCTRIRDRVTFSYLNLAEDIYPALLNSTNAMDVIFCRNVLMYFEAQRAREVVQGFYRSLVEGGCLIVSPSEASTALFSSFSAASFGGVGLYQKSAGARPGLSGIESPAAPAGDPDALPWHPCATPPDLATPEESRLVPTIGAVTVLSESSKAVAPEQTDGRALAAAARSCADEGRLAEAAAWCARAVAADKVNPAHQYLLATICQEQGEIAAAAAALRRVLFLDPAFALGHFGLANLALSTGRRREAGRHLENTLAALQARAPHEIVPESEGLTAGRLAEIATSVLASLPTREDATTVRSVVA